MNEIIQRLMERIGLPEDKVQTAVNTVIGFLKERLPEPLASLVDYFLDSSSEMPKSLGGLADNLGDMFGRRG